MGRYIDRKTGQLNISLDVLATADGSQWARYGYNIGSRQFFIDHHNMATTTSKEQKPYTAQVPAWISIVALVDGGVVESFTDSAADMAAHSPKHVPLPNGAVTTRSFLPSSPPFELNASTGRGVYISAMPEGVRCELKVADLEL